MMYDLVFSQILFSMMIHQFSFDNPGQGDCLEMFHALVQREAVADNMLNSCNMMEVLSVK